MEEVLHQREEIKIQKCKIEEASGISGKSTHLYVSFESLPPLLLDLRHPVWNSFGWKIWHLAGLLQLHK